MTILKEKASKLKWGDAWEIACGELKGKLTMIQVLLLLEGDENLEFDNDASKIGLGCVWMKIGG